MVAWIAAGPLLGVRVAISGEKVLATARWACALFVSGRRARRWTSHKHAGEHVSIRPPVP